LVNEKYTYNVAINYKRQKYKAKKHILHKKSLKTKIIRTYDKDHKQIQTCKLQIVCNSNIVILNLLHSAYVQLMSLYERQL